MATTPVPPSLNCVPDEGRGYQQQQQQHYSGGGGRQEEGPAAVGEGGGGGSDDELDAGPASTHQGGLAVLRDGSIEMGAQRPFCSSEKGKLTTSR